MPTSADDWIKQGQQNKRITTTQGNQVTHATHTLLGTKLLKIIHNQHTAFKNKTGVGSIQYQLQLAIVHHNLCNNFKHDNVHKKLKPSTSGESSLELTEHVQPPSEVHWSEHTLETHKELTEPKRTSFGIIELRFSLYAKLYVRGSTYTVGELIFFLTLTYNDSMTRGF